MITWQNYVRNDSHVALWYHVSTDLLMMKVAWTHQNKTSCWCLLLDITQHIQTDVINCTVCDPTIWQPGFDLPRQQWSLLNRFRTEQGHCGACRRKWRLTDTDLCPCGKIQRCLTLSNPVPWQNWMVTYLRYTLQMKTLFRGWPLMVRDTHMRRRSIVQMYQTNDWPISNIPDHPSLLLQTKNSCWWLIWIVNSLIRL